MRAVQRVAGSCLLLPGPGEAVLVRRAAAAAAGAGAAAGADAEAAPWALPGSRVRHGEHPREAAVRGVLERTGLRVSPPELAAVGVETVDLPGADPLDGGDLRVHLLQIVYAARPAPGQALPAGDGTAVRLVRAGATDGLPLTAVTARTMALPVVRTGLAAPPSEEDAPGLADGRPGAGGHGEQGEGEDGGLAAEPLVGADGVPQVQRAGAYAVCVATVVPTPVGPDAAPDAAPGATPDGTMTDGAVADGDPRPCVLLTRISGSRRWTLPGGGIDPGEDPVVAVHREVYEEAGLPLRDPRLVGVDSLRFTGTSPDGRREDFHGIRVLYAGSVPTDVRPRVVEVDGTTDAAAWVPLAEADDLGATALVRAALGYLRRPAAVQGT